MGEIVKGSLAKNYVIVANSQIGKDKIENQDSYKIHIDKNCIICCIADGLGSVPFSKEGSSVLVEIGCELLLHDVSEDFSEKIRKEWKERIKGNYELYDSTFKFIKITNNHIIYGGIGDGWIAFENDKSYINETVDHEFANHTDTIMSIGMKERFVIKTIKNKMNVGLLATDGFSEDIDKSTNDFVLDVAASIENNPDDFIKELEELMKNWPVKSNKDDKTIVIIKQL